MVYPDPIEKELYRVQKTSLDANSYESPSSTPMSNAHTFHFHQPKQTQTIITKLILKHIPLLLKAK